MGSYWHSLHRTREHRGPRGRGRGQERAGTHPPVDKDEMWRLRGRAGGEESRRGPGSNERCRPPTDVGEYKVEAAERGGERETVC